MFDFWKTAKGMAFASAAGVIILLQFTLLTAALDFITSLLLIGIGFVAGRFSK